MVRLALLVLAALALFVSLCAAGKQQQALRASTASTALVEATAEDAEGARIVFCTIMGSLAIARNAYNLHAMAEKEAMEKTIKRQFVGSMNKLMDWIDSPCPTPEAGTKKVAFEQRQLAESMIFALVNSFVNCEGTVGANEKPYDKSKYAGDFKVCQRARRRDEEARHRCSTAVQFLVIPPSLRPRLSRPLLTIIPPLNCPSGYTPAPSARIS